MAETLEYGEFWLPSEFLTDDDPLFGNDDPSSHLHNKFGNDDLSSHYHNKIGNDDLSSHRRYRVGNDGLSIHRPHNIGNGELSSHRQNKVSSTFNRFKDNAKLNLQSNDAEMGPHHSLISWNVERRKSSNMLWEVAGAHGLMFDPIEENVKPTNISGVVENRGAGYLWHLQKFELIRQRLILEHLEKLWSEDTSMNLYGNREKLCFGGYYQQPRSTFHTAKKQRAGTGVFLPRRCEALNTDEPSNVLFPARVVQALNLSVQDFSNIERRYYKTPNVSSSFPKITGDIRLPPDWTY